MGKKKQPFYRIVVMEETKPRESKYVEQIGWYNPIKENAVSLEETKVFKWLDNGAQPTGTVKALLSKSGLLKKYADNKSAARKKSE